MGTYKKPILRELMRGQKNERLILEGLTSVFLLGHSCPGINCKCYC